jgi:CO dehydrogenase/acetyl-CoA synthase epsilon subunit
MLQQRPVSRIVPKIIRKAQKGLMDFGFEPLATQNTVEKATKMNSSKEPLAIQ